MSKHHYIARFVFGFPLAKKTTDATWLYRGRTKRKDQVKVTAWAYLAGWQRMFLRWLAMGGVISFTYLYFYHREGLKKAFTSLCISIAFLCFVFGLTVYRIITHNRRVVKPILKVAAPYAGTNPRPPRPGKVLKIPRDYWKNEDCLIRMTFDPNTWTGDKGQKEAVNGIVTRRMGKEWTPDWNDDANPPYVQWKRTQYPPTDVSLKDIEADILANDNDGKFILGQGIGRSLITIDLDNESPHVALSIGTGGGKSSVIRGAASQLARMGVKVTIIDPKRISHQWAIGVPNITIVRDTQEQWKAVTAFSKRMKDRYKQLEIDEFQDFQREVIIFEEMNSFIELSDIEWQEIRGKGDPKQAPVFSQIRFILFMGRQAKMHMILISQRLEAKVTGGGAGRGQFGTKIMGRYQPSDWKMLVDTYPRPTSSNHPGRAVVVAGAGWEYVQMAFMTSQEAKEFALNAQPAIAMEDMPNFRAFTTVSDVNVERVTLKEACEREWIPMNYEAAKKARTRDTDFPMGVRAKYTKTELRSWYANRPRIGKPLAKEVAEG